MESMLEKEIEVYSEKYDVHGVIRDYGIVTKLFFNYGGKEIEMAIHRNPLLGEKFEDVGRETIEAYIDKLSSIEKARKLQLHYWYIDENDDDGGKILYGHGIVTGHQKLSDSIKIRTSQVKKITVDEEADELILNTQNSVYHCPLSYCRFKKQDKYPDVIPGYKKLKKKYQDTIEYPSIESGNVLLVLANFCDYYFHSLYYVPEDSKDGKQLDFTGSPHIGTFQDSYLICTEDYKIDLRYFPHYQNIEFYSEETKGCPLYLQNIGDVTLYAKTSAGVIRLEPGDKK